jgi:hypothetical protein
MLRASVETDGVEADYRGIADRESAEESSVPAAGALVGLVEASLSDDAGNAGDADEARARVRRELGSAALVDAAAVIGNFERMTRIADSTGIPLDAPVNVMTESIRAELGIDNFGSAADRASVKWWQRLIGRTLDPIVGITLRWVGRRARSKAAAHPNSERE